MKKLLLTITILAFAVGCKSLRKNTDGATDGGVRSETTASG